MFKVDITDFGARCTGELQTGNIQAAIDYCFKNGGGEVVVPQGDFMCGGVRLRSGVHLHLLENAHLIGSRDPEDYMGFIEDKVEPISDQDITDTLWLPVEQRKTYDHMNAAASRWNNALIRAIDAHDISVTGEKGSYIDGRDCFDEKGEENYRGPHAINFHRCKDVRLTGYEVRNSANWANCLFDCENIFVSGIKVIAGHDGIHMTSCKNISIKDCAFYTGDDCIAGIDNRNVEIEHCIMNTACSALRFGGVAVNIKNCEMFGPAKYLFRGSLSDEEKREGVCASYSHRYNMLSAYTYYADYSREIVNSPCDVMIENCSVRNTDRLIHYNFSGNERWQRNKPLRSITIKNIQASGIRLPLNVYGSSDIPVIVDISDSNIGFGENEGGFMNLCNYEAVKLENTKISHLKSSALIKKWSNQGQIVLKKVEYDPEIKQISETADEEFVCAPI